MSRQFVDTLVSLEKAIILLQDKLRELLVNYKYLQFENEALKREKQELLERLEE